MQVNAPDRLTLPQAIGGVCAGGGWWRPPRALRYATHVGRRVRPAKETITMTTTFQQYPPGWHQNYCTRPTIDVTVQPDTHVCALCDGDLIYVRKPDSYLGQWQHADPTATCAKPVSLKRCTYCHAHNGYIYDNEPNEVVITSTQEAWYDRTHCTRCGGVHGYPIGD